MALPFVHTHWPLHFRLPGVSKLSADVWAGFAAMLVALPSSVAFGVATYSVLGPGFAAQGAIAGVIGAAVLGIVAPALGGAPRLISAPCAPAAAMLAALAAEAISSNSRRVFQPNDVLLILTLVALSAGALQLIYGLARGGQLIKYIPYPVISGYLTSVGLIILLGQVPNFLGLAKGVSLSRGLLSPGFWQWPSVIVGAATIVAVLVAPKISKTLPAPIWGLTAGVMTYFALALIYPEYFRNNRGQMQIGAVSGGVSAIRSIVQNRWSALGNLTLSDAAPFAVEALTLSILLSIDTLKTCVVVDTLTRARHNSNRELIAQGVANSISALFGGMPGSGVTGATMVNVSSGARSSASSTIEGLFVVAAFFFFGSAIGQIPIAALAGILIVVAVRMLDVSSLHLLRSRSTLLDFLVIAAVIAAALRFDLIIAAGVGLAFSIMLFIREQIRGSVIRRKLHGDQISSKRHRLAGEKALLRERGSLITICQLQGSLFFGTTDQLFNELELDLKQSRYVILDMFRVQSIDFTAVHMLQQIQGILKDQNGQLVFANFPASLPTGKHLEKYLRQLESIAPAEPARTFDTLDESLEWAEDRILAEFHAKAADDDRPLELCEMELLKGADPEAVEMLARCSRRASYAAGEKIFDMGDGGDELFLIRKGLVRISLPLAGGRHYNVTTFARGDFFGDIAFLDHGNRSADATADVATEVFAISRSRFDEVAREKPVAGNRVLATLARALAIRLRYADSELRALQEA